jgi:hypothetical protein
VANEEINKTVDAAKTPSRSALVMITSLENGYPSIPIRVSGADLLYNYLNRGAPPLD